jgi:hypothetical protein
MESHLSNIYSKLKDEETDDFIQHLIVVPEDILHYFSVLATRRLKVKHFSKLKTAYLRAKDKKLSDRFISKYVGFLFYHFPKESLEDKEVKEAFKSFLEKWLDALYSHEIERVLAGLLDSMHASHDTRSFQDVLDIVYKNDDLKSQDAVRRLLAQTLVRLNYAPDDLGDQEYRVWLSSLN